MFREWGFAFLALAASVGVRSGVRASLNRLVRKPQWKHWQAVASPLANGIYFLGLGAFLQLAPVSGLSQVWLDHSIYLVAAIWGMTVSRQLALLGLDWAATRSAYSQALTHGFVPILRNIITLLVFAAGSVVILKRFNYDVMSILAALGVGSLAIGLAAKETLANMISGFILMVDRNLTPGDRINLAGMLGEVEEIGLRSTRLKTPDGNTLIVPNTDLVNNRILNLSQPTRETSVSTTLHFYPDAPFPTLQRICADALSRVPQAETQRGNWIHLTQLGEGKLTITVGFWIHEMTQSAAALSEFHLQVLEQIKAENIMLYSSPAPASVAVSSSTTIS